MRPAFLVEGDQEKLIIERLCTNYTVRAFRTNGESVKLQTIADALDRQLRNNLYNRYYPIVILFDREKRAESTTSIISEINKYLTDLSYDTKQFIIGIPNRKMENWILPFIDSNGNFTDKPTNIFEGENCTGELERRLAEQNTYYDKVDFGPRIFGKINPEELARVSDSFELFYNELIGDDELKKCWWFNK